MGFCQDQHNLDVEVAAQVVGLQDVAPIMCHRLILVLATVVTLVVGVTGVDHPTHIHHHLRVAHVVLAAQEVQLS